MRATRARSFGAAAIRSARGWSLLLNVRAALGHNVRSLEHRFSNELHLCVTDLTCHVSTPDGYKR